MPRRKTASQKLEQEIRAQGYHLVAGIDEAGRGPLAGPVCAAAVIFEPGVRISGVYDSKQVEPEEREELFEKIMRKALCVGVGMACAEEIDHLNILRATKLAARRAIRNLAIIPDYLLLDALYLEKATTPQRALVKGDSLSFSIAAASIVAKVSRDRLMVRCAEQFPGYLFESHKGYATPTHRRCIRELGPSTLHRQTFLQSWFGTEGMRHSRLHEFLCGKLHLCDSADIIHDLLAELRAHREWLPVKEWNDLSDRARQKLSLLG
jgi:ribonuclease HII